MMTGDSVVASAAAWARAACGRASRQARASGLRVNCLLYTSRDGGQAQYIEHPLPKGEGGDRLRATLDWAIEHLDQPLCLDQLAARASMSRRNFTRHFKAQTGATVSQWLLNHRLASTQRLLETSDHGIDLSLIHI